jgi:hypothetical protein
MAGKHRGNPCGMTKENCRQDLIRVKAAKAIKDLAKKQQAARG